MSAPEPAWRLLTTLTDRPSAQSLAAALRGAGIEVRVSSDAGVLGEAAPTRLYVASAAWQEAEGFLAAGATAAEPPAPAVGR